MRGGKSGFTLIELLVAMAILGIIVVICGQLFEQATTTWNTGVRKAEMNMAGRGLADFIARDISRCVMPTNKSPPTFGGGSASFWVIDESSVPGQPEALQEIKYSLGDPPTRNSVSLAPKGLILPPIVVTESDSGGYVDVAVTVKEDVEGSTETKTFKARAWLGNRDRYAYEE